QNVTNDVLQNYLNTGMPQSGAQIGNYLIVRDDSGALHMYDLSGMPAVMQVTSQALMSQDQNFLGAAYGIVKAISAAVISAPNLPAAFVATVVDAPYQAVVNTLNRIEQAASDALQGIYNKLPSGSDIGSALAMIAVIAISAAYISHKAL